MLGCVPVALLPLLYDTGAVEEGYIGELIVVCPAYVVLGLLIIKGKELLVTLREHAEALALLDPLTELPNRRAMVEWLAGELQERVAHRADPGGPRRLQGREHGPRLSGRRRRAVRHRRASERLVRPDDLVARLGGDEFAILARGATPERDVRSR